jgi:hypothetical protein
MPQIARDPAEMGYHRCQATGKVNLLKGAYIYNGSAVSTLMERTTHLVLLAQMKRMGCLECLTGIHEKNYGMYPPRYGKPSLWSLPLRPCDEFRCRFTHFFRNGGTAQHAGDFFFSPHPLEYSGRRGCPLAVQPLFHK